MPNHNPYSQTDNPNWRDHPNFSWKSSNNNVQTSQPPFQAHHNFQNFYGYAPHYVSPPKRNLEETLHGFIVDQWILGGSEKIEGRLVDIRRCNMFSNWIQNYGLIDFGSIGPKFTWQGQEIRGYGRVFERLDGGLGNHLFKVKFPELIIKMLPRIKSDHHPILVQTHNRGLLYRGTEKPFRSEAA